MDIQSIPTEIAFLTLIDPTYKIRAERSINKATKVANPHPRYGPRLFDGFSAFDPAVRVASAFPKGMAVKISDRIVPDQNFRLIIASCFLKCKIYFGGF